MTFLELIQNTDAPICGKRAIDFDCQDFAYAFIKDVERTEAFASPQGVVHEIYRPHLIRQERHFQRLFDSGMRRLMETEGVELPVLTFPSLVEVPKEKLDGYERDSEGGMSHLPPRKALDAHHGGAFGS